MDKTANLYSANRDIESQKENEILSTSSCQEFGKIFVTFCSDVGFTINSISMFDGSLYSVTRNYEQFKVLHQSLIESNLSGIIVPPLPEMFEPEEKDIPRSQLAIIKECDLIIENIGEFGQYLRALSSHHFFSSNKILHKFLTLDNFSQPELNLSTNCKQSTFLNFSSDKWKYNHKDCDDFYEKQRFFAVDVFDKLANLKNLFENVSINNRKLSNVIAHFSTSLTSNLVIKEIHPELANFNKTFCNSLDSYKTYLELGGTVSHNTLGIVLQYLFAYNIAFKEMLFRRLEFMINYENANKNLERSADSKNYEKACSLKKIAEYEFEQFSDIGRHEIKRYHKYRTQEFIRAINDYVKCQLIISKKTTNLFRNCISNLKKI